MLLVSTMLTMQSLPMILTVSTTGTVPDGNSANSSHTAAVLVLAADTAPQAEETGEEDNGIDQNRHGGLCVLSQIYSRCYIIYTVLYHTKLLYYMKRYTYMYRYTYIRTYIRAYIHTYIHHYIIILLFYDQYIIQNNMFYLILSVDPYITKGFFRIWGYPSPWAQAHVLSRLEHEGHLPRG